MKFLYVVILILASQLSAAPISRVTSYTNGEILESADLNAEFDNIINGINNLDETNLTPTFKLPAPRVGIGIAGEGIERDVQSGAIGIAPRTVASETGTRLHVVAGSVYNSIGPGLSATPIILSQAVITPTRTDSVLVVMTQGSVNCEGGILFPTYTHDIYVTPEDLPGQTVELINGVRLDVDNQRLVFFQPYFGFFPHDLEEIVPITVTWEYAWDTNTICVIKNAQVIVWELT